MTDCGIVVVTHNRRRRLDATLRSLGALPEAPPIVVVDNGSNDGTAEFVRRCHPRVQLVALTTNIGAAARTIGVRVAGTRYVAFCDDDCCWRPGAIARAVELLEAHPEVGLLNAQVIVNGARIDTACSLMASSHVPKSTNCPGNAIAQFMAGASVVRRDAFLAAGGYHRRYHLGAEESLLALDLLDQGWELIYARDLVVDHRPCAEGRDPVARRLLVMRNRLWTAWLRRSWPVAWAATFALVRSAWHDRVARAALGKAVLGLPWVVLERRPVRPGVERLLASLTELPP